MSFHLGRRLVLSSASINRRTSPTRPQTCPVSHKPWKPEPLRQSISQSEEFSVEYNEPLYGDDGEPVTGVDGIPTLLNIIFKPGSEPRTP
jgi:hypothetical protein